MHLKFEVLHLTANNNLLLAPVGHKQPISRKKLFLERQKTAEIFDTIAKIDAPLYLAKPLKSVKAGEVLEGESK